MLNVVELNVKQFESRYGYVNCPFGTRSKRRGGRELKDLEYIMETLINTAWATFGSTLRRLKLHFPHYCYSAPTMPSTMALVFPRLEELDIASYTIDFLRDQVIPFINNHHSSLKVLTLRFNQVASMYGSVEACSCIPAIRTIPNLKKFDFYHSVQQETLHGYNWTDTILVCPQFSGIQMLHLQVHSGHFHNPDQRDQDSRSSIPIPLPCLASLVYPSPVCCTVIIKNDVAADLQMYMRSFSTLNLERVCLVLAELRKLDGTLAQQSPIRLGYWLCGCRVPITWSFFYCSTYFMWCSKLLTRRIWRHSW
jgi:hypothetical protein